MPGWNRKCPLGVPLIVHILTLAGPGPFLCADVGVGRGGSDFRDLMFLFFLTIFHYSMTVCQTIKFHLKFQPDSDVNFNKC